MGKKVLITGGAGYIGSHTVKKLIEAGYETFVIDNFSTGSTKLLLNDKFIKADIADKDKIDQVVKKFSPDAVIHFAASKDASESVLDPQKYFRNNVSGTIALLEVLLKNKVKNIVFSSSAAVYGEVRKVPITEEFSVFPTNPYGWSKLMIEQILLEYQKSLGLRPLIFRYFNAGGADSSRSLGNLYPDPKDVISAVLASAKENKPFVIFGTDYKTKDGTCIRDIIHVEDLAEAHVKGVQKLLDEKTTGIYNLGSENGYTIKEIVETTKIVTGAKFEVDRGARRVGDIVVSIASSEKAKKDLGWEPKKGIKEIIKDAWLWKLKN